MLNHQKNEIRITGIGGSPGICIGQAYLVDREGVDIVEKYFIRKEDLQQETSRFKAAVQKAAKELRTIIENTPEDYRQHARILETHLHLLKDKMLYEKTIELIEQDRVNAEWALKKVVANVKSVFEKMTDDYLKERATDITHASDRIMHNLAGVETNSMVDVDKRVILVANDLSPAETSQIQLVRIKGFVTDHGGKASHTSIIARSLQIPAVLGLGNATGLIQTDDFIIVDGSTGVVIIHPSPETIEEFKARQSQYEIRVANLIRTGKLPAETLDGFNVQVMGNIELPEEVVSVLNCGGDGIGLYRTEFQYMNRPDFPPEDELFEKYKNVVDVMGKKAVTIRTLDINGDKALVSTSYREERNPALGLRAIRYCLSNPEMFKTQLRAILRVAAFGNVRVLFPMISSYEELMQAKELLNEAARSLEKENMPCNPALEVGILIEVPSVVIMADVMAKEVDFFSIGTNDLIQYSFAIDRGNRYVAHLYQPMHPAIIRMLKQVCDVARDEGIKVVMCGEMAGEPIHTPLLMGLGVDEMSVNPQFIPAIKRMVRDLKFQDARQFVKAVLSATTTGEISEMVQAAYGEILTEIV
jgi:phosphotransferase system enzyme I (PtsI)